MEVQLYFQNSTFVVGFSQVLQRSRRGLTSVRHRKAPNVRKRGKMVKRTPRPRRQQHCYNARWQQK